MMRSKVRRAEGRELPRPSWGEGRLRDFRVKKGSRKGYERVLRAFGNWLVEVGANPQPEEEEKVDELGEQLIEYVHRTGLPAYWAFQLTAALQWRFPVLVKGKAGLPLSHAAASGFRKVAAEETSSYPPLVREIVLAAAAVLWSWNREVEAIAVLLSYNCYLRTEELMRLKWVHVMLPGDMRMTRGEAPSLTVEDGKSGPLQSVVITDPLVLELLMRWSTMSKRNGRHKVFPGLSGDKGRRWLYAALGKLGIKEHEYVWHSLRKGAAMTDSVTRALSFEQIMVRGRWESRKSCKLYIAKAKADLAGGLPWGHREGIMEIARTHHGTLFGLPASSARFCRL